MIKKTLRRLLSAAFTMPFLVAGAYAALPPQYPTGMDSCRVVANAEPSIEYKPSPPGTPVAPGPGAGRIYTVPATLDCSPGGKHSGTYYLCQPSFLAWAKEACNGLNVRE